MRKSSSKRWPLSRPWPSRSLRLSVVVVATWVMATVSSAQEAGEIEMVEATYVDMAGETVPYELGTFYVPENRDDPESRVIGIAFARFPAQSDERLAPPVFRLPGGPGSSFVSRFKTATPTQISFGFPELASLRDACDVVFVDQRGFSESGDMLKFTLEMPGRDAERPQTLDDLIASFEDAARQAVSDHDEQNIDLRGYTVKECAHDVAELSAALGYDQITLCGTSFGSQWSFAIMKMYPELVARALLSGVEPLNHGFDMPSHVFAAMRRVWREIDTDPRFEAFLPEGGMEEAARTVIERLEREPIQFFNQPDDGGEPRQIGIFGPEDFPWRDPVQILELYHGEYERFKFFVRARRSIRRPMDLIGPLIDSSLGVTPDRRYQLWTDPAVRYLGRDNFAPYLATANIWPSPDVGNDFRTPQLCDIPVVFAQGDWDFQTPIENTYEIAPFFPNSRVVIANRGGHGVLQPIAVEHPDVWSEFMEFVTTGDMSDIPARVRLRPSLRIQPPTFDIEEE